MQNANSAKNNYQTSIVNHPELLNINYLPKKDWMHMNGIDYNPMFDQIVLSAHNTNEFYVIDHSTTTAEAASHSGGRGGRGGAACGGADRPRRTAARPPRCHRCNAVRDASRQGRLCPRRRPGSSGARCIFQRRHDQARLSVKHPPGLSRYQFPRRAV